MRKFAVALLTTTALGFTVGQAFAADFPISGVLPGSPSLYAPRPFSWSGVYVGVNAGGAFGRFSDDFGDSVSANGFIGGGQVGAQIQYQKTVLGIEADFQGSTQDHSDTFGAFTLTERMPWFATVRGRLGWVFDNVLLYGTGGIAVVDSKITGSALGLTASTDSSHIGWTAGGGVEWAFAQHWTAKVEYLYIDSGNIDLFNVGGVTFNGRIKDNIVRAGINYYLN